MTQPPILRQASRRARASGAIGLLVAVLTAAALPVGYVAITYEHTAASIETTLAVKAEQLNQFVSTYPQTWQFQERRLVSLLANRSAGNAAEQVRLTDSSGELLFETPELPVALAVSRTATVYDAGTPVGRLELRRSLNMPAWRTGLLTVLGALLGVAVYIFLRVLPLRTLHAAHNELRQAHDYLDYLAHHDSLTGLPNRALLRNRLADAIRDAERRGLHVAVLFLDLDRFKIVNDTLGHSAGDALLLEVCARLKKCVRDADTDTVARLGGDEFTVVLPALADMQAAGEVAHRIVDQLSLPIMVAGHELSIATSIGITGYPRDAQDIDGLLHNADAAMYQAKTDGGQGFAYYTQRLSDTAVRRAKVQQALAHAVKAGEFTLHYQPKLRLRDDMVVGVEALMRWTSAELGAVSPVEFIPLLEESGQIVQVGEWALREAVGHARHWLDAELGALQVSVNLSARQFRQPDLADKVFSILREHGLPPACLELEITESMLMDREMASRQLAALKAGGVHIALDDFGTGYSSLSYLRHYPIDVLKIDRSFVRDIHIDLDDNALVEAIIAMAHRLRIVAVAEGVETEEQVAFLRSHGCDQVQGYWLGRPMSAEELWRWLHGRRMQQQADARRTIAV